MFPHIRRSLFITVALCLLVPAWARSEDGPATASRKIDRALRASLDDGKPKKRVIVSVKSGYRSEIRKALTQHGDVVTSESSLVQTIAAEVHTEDVHELARHPWVEALSIDADVFAAHDDWHGHDSPVRVERWKGHGNSGPRRPLSSTLRETLGLPALPAESTPTGAGVGIAVVDSGIARIEHFRGRITAFYDFTRGGIATVAYDDYGHGTHVAGLIGSSGALTGGELIGVAPRVHFAGFKVLNREGRGSASHVIAAIDYIVANRARLNVHIINLSIGHPIYAPAQYDPLVRAVEAATDAGLIVVVAAGNHGASKNAEPGYTGITSPGNAPSAITVGATDTRDTVTRLDDVVAAFSSRGPSWFDAFAKPDAVAPGHRLTSDATLSSTLYRVLSNVRPSGRNHYLELSGTSMAAAVTTGVVATMLEANTQPLPPNAVKAILQFTAIPVGVADALTQGAGQVNAAGAIALASAIDTSAPTGHWWLRSNADDSSYTTIGGASYSWSRRVIWGDDALAGDLVYTNAPAWAVSAQWGDDNIVWGTWAFIDDDNIVWGTTEVWAANLVWTDHVVGLTDGDDNIVWGTDDNIVWGTLSFDNIVWGTWDGDNIVWGTWDGDNIVWGTWDGDDNIVWGTDYPDDIVWGTDEHDNIVWGTAVLSGAR